MKKGILTRIVIAEILYKLKNSDKKFDELLSTYIAKYSFVESDIKMIQSITLTTIRNFNIIIQILDKFIPKINKKNITYYLIISAISQIHVIKLKEYAVINSTCEACKLKKGDVGFVNAVLRNITRNKKIIENIDCNKSFFPQWFKNNIKSLPTKKRKAIYKSILEKPSIHIQLKNQNLISNINIKYIRTSKTSICLKGDSNISKINGYKEGYWWIQDIASAGPIKLLGDIKEKKVIDLCCAPGSKTFQLLNGGAKVTSYDISLKRINIMKENLNRLKYDHNINHLDILKIKSSIKYEVVLLDAPCSATGTLKRNPEIIYRNNGPKIENLVNLQYKMLVKASELVDLNGILLYVVCSIFDSEGIDQIKKFLKDNKNFKISKFNKIKEVYYNKLLTKDGFFQSFPFNYKELGGFDGFFAAKLIKIK